MTVSELQPGPTVSVSDRDDPALVVAIARLAARLDLTLQALLGADAALRRSAAALFATPAAEEAVEAPALPMEVTLAAAPWPTPPWLKPLEKSLAKPAPSLARLFAATFERWFSQSPDAASLRDLWLQLNLPRDAAAIFAAVLTLPAPPTPADLASALADESLESRRRLLAAMLPGAPLSDHGLLRAGSPLSPLVPEPLLFAPLAAADGWFWALAERHIIALPTDSGLATADAPEAWDEEDDSALVQAISDAVAAATLAVKAGTAWRGDMDAALAAITTLRTQIPFGGLGPTALALLRGIPRSLVALCLAIPGPAAVVAALDAFEGHPEDAHHETLRALVSEIHGAAITALGAQDYLRALTLVGITQAFARKHGLRDLGLIALGLQAEAESKHMPTLAATSWRAVLAGVAAYPRLAALSLRAQRQLYPAFGLFAPKIQA